MLKSFFAAVLLSALVERFGVSRMRDFFVIEFESWGIGDCHSKNMVLECGKHCGPQMNTVSNGASYSP